MKCPYFSSVEDGITTEKYKNDPDTQQPTQVTRITHTTWQMADCIKEECAAYQNDRCRYKD